MGDNAISTTAASRALTTSPAAEATTAHTVHALVERAAQQWPQATYALNDTGTQTLNFADLRASCRQVGAWLHSQGSAPGQTVALVMPNGLATLQLLLGAMHGGWCVCPVNLLSQPQQMRYVLEHSDCTLVFASPEWADVVRGLLASLTRAVQLIVVAPDAVALPLPDCLAEGVAASPQPQPQPLPAPSPDAIALLMYTSGTTGVPKGVMLTQSNLAANAQAVSAEHELRCSDRVLAVLPLYHINAFAVTMLAPLAHGGSLVMPPKLPRRLVDDRGRVGWNRGRAHRRRVRRLLHRLDARADDEHRLHAVRLGVADP